MLSQFFILSPRGDAVVSKDFRRDLSRRTHETFYRLVRFWRDEDEDEADASEGGASTSTTRGAPAAFHRDGVNYMHIKASGLYFVSTTTSNASPSAVLELMHRLARLVKDYCGALTEEAVRRNTTLVYELIDEAMDYGYAQTTSTEMLRERVCNEPVEVGNGLAGRLVSAKVDSTKIGAGALKAGQKVETMLKLSLIHI